MNTLRPENQLMKNYLLLHGIDAKVMYIAKGSEKGTWRIVNQKINWYQDPALWDKFNSLGFTDSWGKPLGLYSSNGGCLAIIARSSLTEQFLKEAKKHDNE